VLPLHHSPIVLHYESDAKIRHFCRIFQIKSEFFADKMPK